MQRKDAILRAACEHFGRFGFRGASLRDIARDAGVSLTLLDHHFGNKSGLLDATLQAHREMMDARAAALLQATCRGAGRFSPRDLVEAWVRTGLATAARPEGPAFLRLVARLTQDASETGADRAQDRLDAAGLVCIDALLQCYPDASRQAAASAWVWMTASVQAFLLDSPRVSRLAETGPCADPQTGNPARLTNFLVAGLDAALAEVDAEDTQASHSAASDGTAPARTADMAT